MAKTIAEKLDEIIEYRVSVKLAALDAAYEGDEVRRNLFDSAIKFIQEKIASNELPAAETDILIDLASSLVEDKIQKMASEEEETLNKQADELEGQQKLGDLVATLLDAKGIDSRDLLGLDTEAKIKEAADMCGQLVAEYLIEKKIV